MTAPALRSTPSGRTIGTDPNTVCLVARRVRIRVCYCLSQPPTRPDEQRGVVHRYAKTVAGVALAFTPRSTQDSSQPLMHLMVVSPIGASTTNSNAGADVCALPTIQPRKTRIAVNTIWTMLRALIFIEPPEDYAPWRSTGALTGGLRARAAKAAAENLLSQMGLFGKRNSVSPSRGHWPGTRK